MPTLDTDSKEQLARRTFIGQRCIALAFDGPWTALDEAPESERETSARDAVSDILTALFGPAGFNVPTKMEDHVVTDWSEAPQLTAQETARVFLDMAFDSWLSDAEDYTAENNELSW